jgi:hypothetical protein
MVSALPEEIVGEETLGGGRVGEALLTVWTSGDEVTAPYVESPP